MCIGHPLGGDALGAGVGRAECIGHPLGGLEVAIASWTRARTRSASASQGGNQRTLMLERTSRKKRAPPAAEAPGALKCTHCGVKFHEHGR